VLTGRYPFGLQKYCFSSLKQNPVLRGRTIYDIEMMSYSHITLRDAGGDYNLDPKGRLSHPKMNIAQAVILDIPLSKGT
jgi:hypothetical protein